MQVIIDENYNEGDPRRYNVEENDEVHTMSGDVQLNSAQRTVTILSNKEWKKQRLTSLQTGIVAAIRYGIQIEEEWVKEYNELIKERGL